MLQLCSWALFLTLGPYKPSLGQGFKFFQIFRRERSNLGVHLMNGAFHIGFPN